MIDGSRSQRLGRRLSWFAVLVAVCPSPVMAQHWEMGPRLGAYVPVGAIIDQAAGSLGAKGIQKRQVGSVFVGFRATAWATKRFAVEGNLALAPSYVAVTDSTGIHDHLAHVLLANTRAILGLTSQNLAYIGAGVGLVGRSGEVWTENRNLTTPALVFSAGARTPIRSRMSIRLEVEDYISRAQVFETLATSSTGRAHNDFLWSVGIMIPLARR